jgi:hypothetical protein
MNKNALVVNKVIYAKRKGITGKEVNEILKLEIQTHLKNNPGLFFIRVDKPTENNDHSKTFPLIFGLTQMHMSEPTQSPEKRLHSGS